ncbi:hypothetical protein [Pseudoalteromonas luteoviolacea]|uniref:hypothetical protein n=1 Tax=Pseudoalteromonas luteoviolacea TaxID=43657 RepID=UPI00114E3B17|nr:hypothetical protein [Pseudoalteromonas luteoviolacea]TQF70733.1 hypothetical protein FLM44_06495 [Pseudoalteromonas luteoviolacea]
MINLSRYYPVLPLTILLSIVFGISFAEYWTIAITQNPEVLNNYKFGSEAMIYHGGEIYRSATIYSEHHLVLALISLLNFLVIIGVMAKCKSYPVFKCYLSAAVLSVIWLLAR